MTVAQLADKLLAPGKKPVRLWGAVWLATGVGLGGLAVMGLPIFLSLWDLPFQQIFSISPFALDLAWVAILLSPAAAAVWSSLSTAHDTRSEFYDLLKLTSLPPAARVELRVRLAIYRVRLLAASTIGLAPVLMVGMFALARRFSPYCITLAGPPSMTLCPVGPLMSTVPAGLRFIPLSFNRIGETTEFHGWVVGMCAAILLGIVLGVTLSLWWRKAAISAVAGGLFMVLLALGTLLPIQLMAAYYLPDTVRLAATLALALWPIEASMVLIRLARRWAD